MDYEALNDNDAYVPIRKLTCPSVTTSEMFVNLLGSCNGLVCLAIEDSDDYAGIILWNPSTGGTTVLPKPPFLTNDFTSWDPTTSCFMDWDMIPTMKTTR